MHIRHFSAHFLQTGKGDSKGGAKGEKTLNEFAVEYAKSNRSTCKGCEQKIEKVCNPSVLSPKKPFRVTSSLHSCPASIPPGPDPRLQEVCGPGEAPAGSDRPLVPHSLFREPQGRADVQARVQRRPAQGLQHAAGRGQGGAEEEAPRHQDRRVSWSRGDRYDIHYYSVESCEDKTKKLHDKVCPNF